MAVYLPWLIILLAIPLILGMVPRNPLYGFRTPKTMSSDENWYPANRIAGIALALAGAAWAALGYVMPQESQRAVLWIGLALLGVAVAVSFVLVYRRSEG